MTHRPFLTFVLLLAALFALTNCAAPATPPPTAVAIAPTTTVPTLPPVTATNSSIPPTATNTPVPPAVTATQTKVPPTATNTPLPPTKTPTRVPPTPTNTPIPPTVTATRVAPSRTATAKPTQTPLTIATIIQAALAKNKAVHSYQGHIAYEIGDAEFLHWIGDVRGKEEHIEFISDFYSEDSEIIVVGDKMYQRPYNFATKSYSGDWKTLPREATLYYEQSPQFILRDLVGNPSLYIKGNANTIEGLQCQTYSHQDKAEIMKSFLATSKGMGQAFAVTQDAIGERGVVFAGVTICSDGYIHAAGVILRTAENASSGSPQLGSISLTITMLGINSKVDINAP